MAFGRQRTAGRVDHHLFCRAVSGLKGPQAATGGSHASRMTNGEFASRNAEGGENHEPAYEESPRRKITLNPEPVNGYVSTIGLAQHLA